MTLPAEMRVVAMTEPGGPDVLVPATAPLPEPRSHEVLIRVEAAGVNGPDLVPVSYTHLRAHETP